jgi:hypothetical protein
MTLITRLSVNFTDTSLPLLTRDPVIPQNGSRFLWDFKNIGTWNRSSGAISATDPIYSIAQADGTSGVDVGNSYISSQSTTRPATDAPITLDFDQNTGRVTFPITQPTAASNRHARFMESATENKYIFNNLSDSYCMSMWCYFDSGMGSTPRGFMLHEPYLIGRFGLFVTVKKDFVSFNRSAGSGYPKNETTTIQADSKYESKHQSFSTDAIHRVGFAWYKDSNGAWYQKAVLDENTISDPLATPNFDTTGLDLGQTTYDGAQDPNQLLSVGLDTSYTGDLYGTGFGFYRVYVENITESGRTPEQVWAADWARGNGRFS